jgi:tetratricopeptide (TPR) repeat protein
MTNGGGRNRGGEAPLGEPAAGPAPRSRWRVRISLVVAVLVSVVVIVGVSRLRPADVPEPAEGTVRDPDIAAAVAEAVATVRSHTSDANAWATLAMTYDANELPALARGRLKEAKEAAMRALGSPRGAPGALIALGRVQLERGKDADAVDSFRKAVAVWPPEWGDAAYARFLLGTALQRVGRDAEAAPYLASALVEPPRLPDPWRDEVEAYRAGLTAHVRRARVAAEAGRFAESIQQFQDLRRSHPDDVPVAADLASVLVLDSQYGEAIAVLREVVASHPGSPEPAAQLVSVLSAARRWEEAVREADRAVAAHPASAVVRAARGAAFLAAGDVEKALADFVEQTRLAPASAAAQTSVGAAQLRLRRIDEAEAAFEQARRRDARHPDAVAGLALVALARGDKTAADQRLAEIARAQAAPGGLVEQARAERAKLGN